MPTINVQQVRTAIRFPEILPATVIRDIPASGEASPLPLDLRRFGSDRFLQLQKLYLDRDDEVRYALTGDDFNIERNAGAVDDEKMEVNISALDTLTYRLYNENTTTPKNDYRTNFRVLITKPTVARKIKYDRELTEDEQRINEEFNIEESVEEGLLPLPFDYIFQRQYQIIDEYVVSSRISSVPTTGSATFEDFTVNPGEALIVTQIGADPFTVANNLLIKIDRDNDLGYVDIMPAAINSLNDDIDFFIPARRELRFRAVANSILSNVDVRIKIQRIKLNDILRVRWGLIEPEDAPGDLGNRVLGGVV